MSCEIQYQALFLPTNIDLDTHSVYTITTEVFFYPDKSTTLTVPPIAVYRVFPVQSTLSHPQTDRRPGAGRSSPSSPERPLLAQTCLDGSI